LIHREQRRAREMEAAPFDPSVARTVRPCARTPAVASPPSASAGPAPSPRRPRTPKSGGSREDVRDPDLVPSNRTSRVRPGQLALPDRRARSMAPDQRRPKRRVTTAHSQDMPTHDPPNSFGSERCEPYVNVATMFTGSAPICVGKASKGAAAFTERSDSLSNVGKPELSTSRINVSVPVGFSGEHENDLPPAPIRLASSGGIHSLRSGASDGQDTSGTGFAVPQTDRPSAGPILSVVTPEPSPAIWSRSDGRALSAGRSRRAPRAGWCRVAARPG